jgi:hypothetical protein
MNPDMAATTMGNPPSRRAGILQVVPGYRTNCLPGPDSSRYSLAQLVTGKTMGITLPKIAQDDMPLMDKSEYSEYSDNYK